MMAWNDTSFFTAVHQSENPVSVIRPLLRMQEMAFLVFNESGSP